MVQFPHILFFLNNAFYQTDQGYKLKTNSTLEIETNQRVHYLITSAFVRGKHLGKSFHKNKL